MYIHMYIYIYIYIHIHTYYIWFPPYYYQIAYRYGDGMGWPLSRLGQLIATKRAWQQGLILWRRAMRSVYINMRHQHCIYIYTYIDIDCTRLYNVCIMLYIYIYAHIYSYINVRIWFCVNIYIYIYIYMYISHPIIYMYVCIYIYIPWPTKTVKFVCRQCPPNDHMPWLHGFMDWSPVSRKFVRTRKFWATCFVHLKRRHATRQKQSVQYNLGFEWISHVKSIWHVTCCVSVLQARRAAEDCFVEGGHRNWIESMSPCPANQYGLLSNSAQTLILSRISIGMSKCMGCSHILFYFYFLGGFGCSLPCLLVLRRASTGMLQKHAKTTIYKYISL